MLLFARALASALLILCATLAQATCSGTDLRPGLTDVERAQIAARLAGTPYAEGNLWTAVRGGQTLHLIGTMHLDDARFAPVTARLAPLVLGADLLLVEATAEDQARLEAAVTTRPELLFLTSGATLPDLLPEETWQTLLEAARARDLPGFLVAKMQPWYLSALLAIPACAMTQAQGAMNGLDNRLIDLAARGGIETRALEPYDTVFSLMGSAPLEEQAALLRLGILPEHVTEDAFATLTASYFEEKSAEVMQVNRIIAHRHVDLPKAEIDALMDEMLASLLVQRNRAWMDPILAAPDGVTVIAAGAAHLPGPQGLLALLEAEGFTLERKPF